MQRKRINLKLFDYDNSLGAIGKNKNVNLDDPQQYFDWLLQNNPQFLDQLSADIREGKYDQIILGDGSNRQDYKTDQGSKKKFGNGSFAWMLPILQSSLVEKVKGNVVIDPFMLADIYGKNKSAGDSYKAILKTFMGHSDQVHARFMFNKYKIPLIYAFAHRVAALHPDAEIVIDFYDDHKETLSTIYRVISQDQSEDFLPQQVTLRLHQYVTGGLSKQFKTDIKGKGRTDENYDWSLRLMAARTFFYDYSSLSDDDAFKRIQEIHNTDYKLDTAKALATYHNDSHYTYEGRRREMGFPDSFGIKEFIALRDNEMLKLTGDLHLTQTANYTTAEKLYQEGFIPKELRTAALTPTVNTTSTTQIMSVLAKENPSEPLTAPSQVATVSTFYWKPRRKAVDEGWKHFSGPQFTSENEGQPKELTQEKKDPKYVMG